MRYGDDPAALCEENGRCLGWNWCEDCGRCYCACRCDYMPRWWRDEYGQGLDIIIPVETIVVRGDYL